MANDDQKDFFYDEVFQGKDAARTVLGPAPDQEFLEASLPIPDDVEAEIAPMCIYRLMTKEQELHLFRKMNYLKYLAASAYGNDTEDRMAHAMGVRNVILKHNTRLLYDIVGPYKKYTRMTTAELFSEANMWMMMEVIDAFDFRLGVPFGAFVSQCVRKRMWTHLSQVTKYRRKMVTGGNAALTEVSDYRTVDDEALDVVDEFARLRDFIWDHTDDEKTRDILVRRLGVNNGVIQSFEEIAAVYGLKYQTVQERFNTTMVKLFGHTVSGHTIRTIQGRAKDNGKQRHIPRAVKKKEVQK